MTERPLLDTLADMTAASLSRANLPDRELMLVRLAVGSVAWWEIVLAVALVVGAIVGLILEQLLIRGVYGDHLKQILIQQNHRYLPLLPRVTHREL